MLAQTDTRRSPHSHTFRIIIADDSELNRRVATVFLETAGYDVVAVRDGRELLDGIEASHYDLVLIDIVMPVMDGLEAAAKIRALPNGDARIPIIGMSAAHDAPFNAPEIDDFIVKPISQASLLEIVAKWIRSGRESSGP